VKQFIKIMKALSDPNRVKIVKLLQRKSLCVCEIQSLLGVSQPTVSSHLKVLEEAGLVGYQKDGLWVNYHVTNGESSPYAAALLGNLRHWLEDEAEVMSLVELLPGTSRDKICKK
jgi:ArsR family transcriptional regulator, arsenate/arsenite/antimonite-responsive transcriptional repressor